LQDLPGGQELGNNCLVLQDNLSLTSPSLQDSQIGASDHVPFVRVDYVPHIPDVDSCIVASNLGFVLSNIVDFLADPPGIGDLLSSFGVAKTFF